MKVIIHLVVFISLVCFSSFAGNNKEPGNVAHRHTILNNKKLSGTMRPKAPSQQFVFCCYDGENLVINFDEPEGMCSMWVTDLSSNFTCQYSFESSNEAIIYVGDLSNAYIYMVTDTGAEYEGYLDNN